MLLWKGDVDTVDTRRPAPAGRIAGNPLAETIGLMGAAMNFERDAEVFAEGEPAEYIYAVVSGAVRFSKLMSDGRRQIGAFYLPGDLFGLEAEEVHSFSAEAIGHTRVVLLKKSAFLARAVQDRELVHHLWAQTAMHLQRAQEHMLLLGRKNAQERIATFLLDMAERLKSHGSFELPMSRQDIADYIGLTIETVSRTLSQLEREQVISMPVARQIVLCDRTTLDAMNDRCHA